ncbi:uncharacterized protein BP5553_09494 [Venustampulla echinocandica]|uniref:Uncharacterized protein n=1 Tax=Venustampulla echinocandica TaxID=2656787 RepID=A0A370TCV9_9HELO|nr:uncharacterized protein BP5553_09494 [Venustampulla echinocandica]RDL32092.1 hypothetical protein BP5553_09494 [Venustampulla echinocandica]
MSSNFQFAFLGCQNNYLASVTEIASGRPLGASITTTYGLPDIFSSEYQRYAARKYFFNIRGHDFLSHVGQWRALDREGTVKACGNSYAEIENLQALAIENNAAAKKNFTASLNVSFGPRPGSFFADACELKRYRWRNLPAGLENEIQRLLSSASFWKRTGYGKIYDVAMNASEGWVLLQKKGEKYTWGGILPEELKEALQQGKDRKAPISRIFLNHQHPDEFMLLFSDGRAYANLHDDFREPLQNLLHRWAENRGLGIRFQYHFRATSHSSQAYQKVLNAAYYNQRGLFHLGRNNAWLALQYLNEAHDQNSASDEIHSNLGMALVAVRHNVRDRELERYLSMPVEARPNPIVLREGELGNFRMSYVGMEARGWNMSELERRLDVFRRGKGRGRGSELDGAWTFEMGCPEKNGVDENGPVEMAGAPLDGIVYSHELRGGDEHDDETSSSNNKQP